MGSSVSFQRSYRPSFEPQLLPECSERFYAMSVELCSREDTLKLLFTDKNLRKEFIRFLKAQRSKTLEGRFLYNIPEVDAESYRTREIGISWLFEDIDSLLDEDITQMIRNHRNDLFFSTSIFMIPRFVRSACFCQWQVTEAEVLSFFLKEINDSIITIPEILSLDSIRSQGNLIRGEATFPDQHIILKVVVGTSRDAASLRNHEPGNQELRDDKSKRECDRAPIEVGAMVSTTSLLHVLPDDKYHSTYAAIDYLETHRLLHCSTWLFAFLTMVENFPLSVTLSSASPDRFGFPLIYMNRHFEKITGHDRKLALGANCRFLQRDGSGRTLTSTNGRELDRLRGSLQRL